MKDAMPAQGMLRCEACDFNFAAYGPQEDDRCEVGIIGVQMADRARRIH